MDILYYIAENALVLIPVLVVVGMILKKTDSIPDKFIPIILLVCGIASSLCLGIPLGNTIIDCIIQGVLVTGVSVYGNQVWKQIHKDE